MAEKIKLTIGIERYDRHFPFFDGTVKVPESIALKVLQVGQSVTLRDGTDRHRRMLKGEFDVGEFSMSSYLMAKGRGMPIAGIPVFPRRLFSHSQMWVHLQSQLWHPKDLIGKKVALSSFQTTLSLLAKGDMKFHYDVPWEKVHWLLTTEEKVKFKVKEGVKLDFVGNRQDLGRALEEGEIDAFFLPLQGRGARLLRGSQLVAAGLGAALLRGGAEKFQDGPLGEWFRAQPQEYRALHQVFSRSGADRERLRTRNAVLQGDAGHLV
jgi:4,5-dihydroxyphthalate decarboxylase